MRLVRRNYHLWLKTKLQHEHCVKLDNLCTYTLNHPRKLHRFHELNVTAAFLAQRSNLPALLRLIFAFKLTGDDDAWLMFVQSPICINLHPETLINRTASNRRYRFIFLSKLRRRIWNLYRRKLFSKPPPSHLISPGTRIFFVCQLLQPTEKLIILTGEKIHHKYSLGKNALLPYGEETCPGCLCRRCVTAKSVTLLGKYCIKDVSKILRSSNWQIKWNAY